MIENGCSGTDSRNSRSELIPSDREQNARVDMTAAFRACIIYGLHAYAAARVDRPQEQYSMGISAHVQKFTGARPPSAHPRKKNIQIQN